jgi:hypothetical protein
MRVFPQNWYFRPQLPIVRFGDDDCHAHEILLSHSATNRAKVPPIKSDRYSDSSSIVVATKASMLPMETRIDLWPSKNSR